MIAETLMPPYYAVIFTSVKTTFDKGNNEISEKMIKLANVQEGFWELNLQEKKSGLQFHIGKTLIR